MATPIITKQEEFKQKLQELFMFDQADLDFGIYRLMNTKRQEITDFVNNKLLTQVKTSIQQSIIVEIDDDQKELAKLTQDCQRLGIDPSTNPKVQELQSRVNNIQSGIQTAEETVFSDLLTFFNRYYDNGDFMPARRYQKDGAYRLPYNGEEVKLMWANQNQYYIKSSENFRDYVFVTPGTKRRVNFVLLNASTEMNNNKTQQNMERRFCLWKPNEEHQTVMEEKEGELFVYFSFELMPKSTKQATLRDDASKYIMSNLPTGWDELLAKNAGEKFCLLERHINTYMAKNEFDFFIHKDLGGFLSRELDYFIKSEVLLLQDLDSNYIKQQIARVKALKEVAQYIIDFLAQLENFQKQLWLKKKFVLETNYCVTLDKIDEKFYDEIRQNKAQIDEWVSMYAIDEVDGFTEVPSCDFLKENPFLLVDTRHFKPSFKHQLVASLGDDLDKQTNGILFNSDNFQALELMQEKYQGRIDCGYFDPPYNTSENGFIYKNNYKHSSWCSMISNRCEQVYKLLNKESGVLEVAIDDYEQPNLALLLDDIFDLSNRLGTLCIEIKPSGRTNDSFLSTSHEYLLCYSPNKTNVDINFMPLTKEQLKQYKETAQDGSQIKWRDFLRTGGYSTPEERPNSYYPIYYVKESNEISLEFRPNAIEILPIDSKGNKRVWRKTKPSFMEHVRLGEIKIEETKNGTCKVRIIDKVKNGIRPKSIWIGSKYDASSSGTKLIQNILGNNKFSFPKSLYNVKDALYIVCNEDSFVFDAFAGSGTTAHAVLSLNREDEENTIKYGLVEMGEYFNTVTLPRVKKVVYSADWKAGKPIARQSGISQIIKYMRLEQYEDTLNNLKIQKQELEFDSEDTKKQYLLNYMMDTETQSSLFDIKQFDHPFDMTLLATKDNELQETPVDLVETFNYLIGLEVQSLYYCHNDTICFVEGKLHKTQEDVLVIWRDIEKIDNNKLNEIFAKRQFKVNSKEFKYIYVNGDNTLGNVRNEDETWVVQLIEQIFFEKMFNVEG